MRARGRVAHRPRHGADAPVLGAGGRYAGAGRLRSLSFRRPARACSRWKATATAASSSAKTWARCRTRFALRSSATTSCPIACCVRARRAGPLHAAVAYPEAALATASTHDLPTLAGWWAGRRYRASRPAHGLVAGSRPGWPFIAQRVHDRQQLLDALVAAGMLSARDGLGSGRGDRPPARHRRAAQAFLAATPCALTMVQAEDAFASASRPICPVRSTSIPTGAASCRSNWSVGKITKALAPFECRRRCGRAWPEGRRGDCPSA